MKGMDSKPSFIESEDEDGGCLALPIYVTRQADEDTRQSLEACKRLLAAASTADGNAKSTPENG